MQAPSSRFILIVEDHDATAQVMARLVQARGFLVVTAHSLAQARQCAREHDVGFVISDLGLPDGDGCELMSELQKQYGLNGASVSGFGMEPDRVRSCRAGFILHLVKPIEIGALDRLLAVARQELDRPLPPLPGIH